MTTTITFKERDRWIRQLARDSNLTAAQYKVGSRLAMSLRVETGELSLNKIECITDACAMSRVTVIHALEALVALGWLGRKRNGPYKANEYVLQVKNMNLAQVKNMNLGQGSKYEPQEKRSVKRKISEAREATEKTRLTGATRPNGNGLDQNQNTDQTEKNLARLQQPHNARLRLTDEGMRSTDGSIFVPTHQIEELRAQWRAIADMDAEIRFCMNRALDKEADPSRRQEAFNAMIAWQGRAAGERAAEREAKRKAKEQAEGELETDEEFMERMRQEAKEEVAKMLSNRIEGPILP